MFEQRSNRFKIQPANGFVEDGTGIIGQRGIEFTIVYAKVHVNERQVVFA
jgi:hypothetical protein